MIRKLVATKLVVIAGRGINILLEQVTANDNFNRVDRKEKPEVYAEHDEREGKAAELHTLRPLPEPAQAAVVFTAAAATQTVVTATVLHLYALFSRVTVRVGVPGSELGWDERIWVFFFGVFAN